MNFIKISNLSQSLVEFLYYKYVLRHRQYSSATIFDAIHISQKNNFDGRIHISNANYSHQIKLDSFQVIH